MAVRTYGSRVRVGNWNEDIQLEEVAKHDLNFIIVPTSLPYISAILVTDLTCLPIQEHV